MAPMFVCVFPMTKNKKKTQRPKFQIPQKMGCLILYVFYHSFCQKRPKDPIFLRILSPTAPGTGLADPKQVMTVFDMCRMGGKREDVWGFAECVGSECMLDAWSGPSQPPSLQAPGLVAQVQGIWLKSRRRKENRNVVCRIRFCRITLSSSVDLPIPSL